MGGNLRQFYPIPPVWQSYREVFIKWNALRNGLLEHR